MTTVEVGTQAIIGALSISESDPGCQLGLSLRWAIDPPASSINLFRPADWERAGGQRRDSP